MWLNEYIERYHYLGHKPLPGAQLRYLIYADDQLIALLGFGAAAWQTAPRDRYIGWSHEQRRANFHFLVNKASASCSRPLPAYMDPPRLQDI